MTGTTVEIEFIAGCKEMKVNRVLTEVYYDAMTRIPTPEYTDEELNFAAELTEQGGLANNGKLFDGLLPLEAEPLPLSVGTDAAEVSHTVPLITISGATMCKGTPLHHWTAAKQAGMSIGHKGMFYAARCMAEGTKHFLSDPNNLKKAWELHLGTPLF
jgi:aminobenzoyl-glutamate utilization protein B